MSWGYPSYRDFIETLLGDSAALESHYEGT
jgi:hypothetical protein